MNLINALHKYGLFKWTYIYIYIYRIRYTGVPKLNDSSEKKKKIHVTP